MFKSKNLLVGRVATVLGFIFLFHPVFFVQAEETTEAEETAPTYWIGIQVVPVPELFLAHFGVTDESGSLMAVEWVVPDGPADKAGLKRGDVIRKFGDREIHTLPDLIGQVSKVKETATELEIIHNGAKKTITVTPVPRPDDIQGLPGILNLREMPQVPLLRRQLPPNAFQGRDPQQMMRQMEEFFRQMQGGDDGAPLLMPNVRPMIQPQGGNTGKQLSVITQTQDGQTTIKVTQVFKDGENTETKAWEVKSVDELPEDIRGDVKMLLGR